ncbi:DoxX family protein [Sphingobacterium chuzhouense]|uniref:DoxX family protein n=1 Tax=Sphingobacterium chuzhouense TaxID=1742264 RepID=A0ABR7XVP8_9SPHI|nr:DoxX family protein [Sphingobacterium chuzhouense]MBD1423131.1 DoxX family protein [Sphingobacterium chuzhouense]
MATSLNIGSKGYWKAYEKGIFRFVFIYFILQAVPLDWKYFKNLFSVNWLNPTFADFFNVSRYTPQFFFQHTSADFWGVSTLADWFVLLIIAGVLSLVWHFFENRKQIQLNYPDLYYILRTVLRYRLALGVIAYGLIKFFPIQAPYPTLSNFNTDYGDLSAWKIFSLTLGVAPKFESVLGGLEILAGLLLLYRGTTAIGAFIVLIFHGNVFLSNLAYEGGETIYSLYLLHIAAFILLYDAKRIIDLFSFNRPAQLNLYRPVYKYDWQYKARIGLKSAFILIFIFVFGYKTYAAHKQGAVQYPAKPGLTGAEGLYDVYEFSRNGHIHPYSKTDSLRWQDVVFEKWSTLSIRSTQKIKPWLGGIEAFYKQDKDRIFELSGSTTRHFYHYRIDSASNTINLENKNPHYLNDRFKLQFERPNENTIRFFGVDAEGDSLQVVLHRIDKKYLYEEAKKAGRRGGLIL